VENEKVSLRDVAPTLLSLFGLATPDYMRGHALPVMIPAITA
jgi:bisphosphoglycerate-independent phosphoglycerate mutase (AlkP superfamily)